APSIGSLAGLPIEYVLGEHRNEDFLWAEVVIHVPGVRRDSPYLRVARENGARIEQEIALFFQACPGKIIGVTGTRGKTTTTTLIYHILRANGMPTAIGGNVSGVETLSLLPSITPETIVVLELSSWQLEGLAAHKISPFVSVMTNIYPDHLDTYNGMEEYAEAKANIFRHQHETDLALFSYDNPWTRRLGQETKAETWYTSLERWGSFARDATNFLPLEGWPETIVKKCRDVVLLKGTGTDELLPAILEATQKLGIANPVHGVFDNFTIAMDTAVSLAQAGDVLLFSPGFTSFGMFLNEFDRGDKFVAYVRR